MTESSAARAEAARHRWDYWSEALDLQVRRVWAYDVEARLANVEAALAAGASPDDDPDPSPISSFCWRPPSTR